MDKSVRPVRSDGVLIPQHRLTSVLLRSGPFVGRHGSQPSPSCLQYSRGMTYKAIQAEVKQAAGFTPKTCWMVHVKEQMGFQMRPDPVLKGYESVTACRRIPLTLVLSSSSVAREDTAPAWR